MDNNRVDTRPCGGCNRGAPYSSEYGAETQCRLCWLFENDPRYTALWTGQPTEGISKPKQPEATINKECVKAQQFRAISTSNGDSLEPIEPARLREPFLAKRGPSLARKAVNFTKAVVQHVAAGLPQSSEELIAKRISICESCPSKLFNPVDRSCTHRSCGCQVDKKAPWADQRCPVGHW